MKIVDLFAGCGGLTLGFEAIEGFEVVAAYDNWEPAIENYQNNFKHPIFKMDLEKSKVVAEHIKNFNPDLIIGGPPCQDFSTAGQRNEGDRANLTISFANIISDIKPKWFVMENVDRARHSKALEKAKDIFKELGYSLTERVLDASLCGAPQKRKRYFCVGGLNEEENFLNPVIDSMLHCKPMTIRDYLGNELGVEHYYRHPRNYSRRGIFSIDEPSPTIRGVNRPIPKSYAGHPKDSSSVNEKVRCLTTLERARLQTFPKSYDWTGTKTNLEQMIGNAVPVKLSEFIAKSLYIYLNTNQNSKKREKQQLALKLG